MIIAGIDEAGYGPLLGPLVVGCCAFDVGNVAGSAAVGSAEPGSPVDGSHLPCIWARLKKYVGKTRSKTGKTIHINDSKQVYSPSLGLKELERSLLALATASADWPESLDALLGRVAPHCLAELAEHPWYARAEDEAFPLEQEGLPIRLFAKSLRAEMLGKSAMCVHLAARVVSERPFNRMVAATRNKASVLFTQAAHHIDHLLRTYGGQDLMIFCDRQGGRSSYGPLLRLMFEEWALEIVEQADGRSEYLLRKADQCARIIFAEKAEAQCLPVAVASMVSKYFREALMRRFNAYWHLHAPDVAPTAGYHPDGVRFVEQIATVRQRLGIRDEDLMRIK